MATIHMTICKRAQVTSDVHVTVMSTVTMLSRRKAYRQL